MNWARIEPTRDASARARALIRARLCYDHLAGRLGVALLAALVDRGVLWHGGDCYQVTHEGLGALAAFGVNAAAFSGRRPAVRYCVDWAEGRHHLAGALGAAVTGRLFALDWLRRGRSGESSRSPRRARPACRRPSGCPTTGRNDRE